MNTKMKPSDLLFKLAILVMTALITVSCSKSDDNDEKGGGGVVPDPDIPTLSEITYDLNKNAVIIPEAATKQLSSVDTLGHKLTLPTSAGKPDVGQCLIFNTPTKQLPDGLLAKVKEVKETSSGYEVIYEDAQLKDAFKNIDIPEQYIPLGQYVEHVYDAAGKEVKFQTKARTRASGIKSFEIVLPEIGWQIDKGIELTPKMSIDLLMRYVFTYGDYELSYAGVKFDADITVGADLNCELKSSNLFEKKFHILTVVCGAIPIGPVLLTPSIDIQGLVKAEGKITLEASISYERTLHAGMIYQKGAGMKATCDLDPEEPDALKFTFGPKFEGGISYGLIMGGNIGVFGKTLAVRSRLNIVKKETISGKLDLAAFTGTLKEWMTPYDIQLMPLDMLNNVKRALEYAKKWNFIKFEDLMYNQAIGIQVGWDLTTIGVDVASTSLPEMSIPISSVPICPQVKIDEKDFMAFEDNDVTLLLHHTGKSVLDDLTEFRAEFKRVNAKSGEQPISKNFNFDDEKRNLLVAEIKGADVTSFAKATLNGEDDYEFVVYMDLLGLEIPIFEGKCVKKTEGIKITKVTRLELRTSFKDHKKGTDGDWYTDAAPVSFLYHNYDSSPADPDYNLQVTQDKDKIHFELTLESSDYYYNTKKLMTFDLTGFKGDFSTSKIENLTYKADGEYYFSYKYTDEWGREQEYKDDYGRIKEINDIGCSFTALPPLNVTLIPNTSYYGETQKINFGSFSYGGQDNDAFLKDYKHNTTVVYKEQADEHITRELVSNPENEVKVNIEFEYE